MKKLLILIVLPYSIYSFAQSGKGLTWGLMPDQGFSGFVNVSCHGKPAVPSGEYAPSCNAYAGDTSCLERLPVLCIKKSEKIKMDPNLPIGKYDQWAGGEIRETSPIKGYDLASLKSANMLCQEYYGPEWRMAEFHDGWGWGFWAKGSIKSSSRFWVYINDQRANCWDHPNSEGQPSEDEELSPSKELDYTNPLNLI